MNKKTFFTIFFTVVILAAAFYCLWKMSVPEPEIYEYDRNDGIYIVRNRNGISVESLTEILKRNDVKKSDAYESGLLDGTTPAYAAYMKLKKSLAKTIQ